MTSWCSAALLKASSALGGPRSPCSRRRSGSSRSIRSRRHPTRAEGWYWRARSLRDGRVVGWAFGVPERIQRRPGAGPAGGGLVPAGLAGLRARLPRSVLSAPCRSAVSGAYPIGRSHARMRRYELMLVLRPDVADDKSQALIDRTTTRHRRVRRPDRQGRPVGPPPAGLPDRPPPRRLVPHHPVRGAVRRDHRAGAHACSSPRRSCATSSPASSARSSRPAPATAPSSTSSSARISRPASRKTRTTTMPRSSSTNPRARRLRPRSTDGRRDHGVLQGHDHRQPRA